MRFQKYLYLGEGITHKNKIIWKLKHGVGMTDIYVISISNGRDQLDCTHCFYLKQKKVRKQLGTVVGLAKGYEEMMELLKQIFEECFQKTGGANVKEYLLGRMS